VGVNPPIIRPVVSDNRLQPWVEDLRRCLRRAAIRNGLPRINPRDVIGDTLGVVLSPRVARGAITRGM